MTKLTAAPYHRDYEITDAMFGAFRGPGGAAEFWRLLLWSTLLLTIFGVLVIPPIISSYIETIRLTALSELDPAAADQIVGNILWETVKWIGLSILYLAVFGIIRAAFFRSYFFGPDPQMIPFRLGRDELNQTLAVLGYYALYMAVTIVATIVLVVPMIALMVALGVDNPAALVLGMILLYVGLAVAVVWVLVRFCCAGSLTALRGQVHVLGSRYVTRNRFWALFGSALVAGLIGYVVFYVLMAMAVGLAFTGLGGADLFTLMAAQDPEAILETLDGLTQTSAFRISSIFAILIVSAGMAFYSLILAGPQGYFTRQWADALTSMEDPQS
ncbi:MAG: hypothetical protein WBG08_09955 [Litorimonas sp.]